MTTLTESRQQSLRRAWCCGSAGIYIRAMGADAVVMANPACIIEIVEILDAGYRRGPEA